jgi:hypothetical protein
MCQKNVSLENDLASLQNISESEIGTIIALMKKSRPQTAKIHECADDSFLRLLCVYVKAYETENLSEEVKVALAPIIDWFSDNIPEVLTLPGLEAFLKAGKKALYGRSIDLQGKSSAFGKKISESLGTISRFYAHKQLEGDDFQPTLRVFFGHRDTLLLDSQGDWDDWLYLTKCLLVALKDQADEIECYPFAWKNIPWEKVNDHLAVINEALRSFERHVREHNPNTTVKSRKTKKK